MNIFMAFWKVFEWNYWRANKAEKEKQNELQENLMILKIYYTRLFIWIMGIRRDKELGLPSEGTCPSA